MTHNQSASPQKRQQILQRLRENRGKLRSIASGYCVTQTESFPILLKSNTDNEHLEAEKQLVEILEMSEETKPSLLGSTVQQKLDKHEQEVLAATQRLKEALQARRKRKQEQQVELESPLDTTHASKRQQLINDALATDFFRNTMQWLGNMDTEPEFSSSSLEEIEALQKQAQYRHKVLQVLLEETQTELDFLRSHIENLKAIQAGN